MIIRFTILLLALCFTGVWFAGIFFDSERERYILRGMKAGLIVAILMVGMVNVF